MITGSITSRDRRYWQNRIFVKDDPINKNDELAMYRALKSELQKIGVLLATEDIHPPESSDIVFQTSLPRRSRLRLKRPPVYQRHSGQLAYLFVLEPPGVLPESANKRLHAQYDRIFTFLEEQADGKRYVLFRWAWDLTP